MIALQQHDGQLEIGARYRADEACGLGSFWGSLIAVIPMPVGVKIGVIHGMIQSTLNSRSPILMVANECRVIVEDYLWFRLYQ